MEPKVYVHTLISIYNRFNDIVVRAFSKDTKFIKSLDNACRHFVNNNPIATLNQEVLAELQNYWLDMLMGFEKQFQRQ